MRALILLLFAVGLAVALVGPPPRGPDKEADAKLLAALIDQLGDDAYAKREAAAEKLEALGGKALAALRAAAVDHKDVEVRRRAEQLVKDITPAFRKSKSGGMKLLLVDAGAFQMGSPNGEAGRRPDEARHAVKITRAFYLAEHEVTQGQYRKLMKGNPSWFSSDGPGKDKVTGVATADFPVERVSWFDAVEYCNRLSLADGLPPYYKLAGVTRASGSITKATVTTLGGRGYRLPTEAEWEYACRAKTTTPFHFGQSNTGKEANVKPHMVSGGYGGSYPKWPDKGRTTKVGSHPANAWGLYDMHGNVAEWCHDWYDKDYYDKSPKADPAGPAAGDHRSLRGGHWLITEPSCRSASRAAHAPGDNKYYAGFRIARNP